MLVNVCTHIVRYQRYAPLFDVLQTDKMVHECVKKTSVKRYIRTKVGMNTWTKTRSKIQTKVHTSGLKLKKEQNFNVSGNKS